VKNYQGKKQIIVLNKLDLPEAMENLQRIRDEFEKDYEIFEVSAATGQGLDELKKVAYEKIN